MFQYTRGWKQSISKGRTFHGLKFNQYSTYRRFNNANQINYSQLLWSRKTAYFGVGCAAFYVYNLEPAPYTQRRRFLWIPHWLERKVGDYSCNQILSQYGRQILPESDPIYSRIKTIMNRLITTAMTLPLDEGEKNFLNKLDWQIHVIQVDPNKVPPNAFILPNGKIFIFSSILPICKDDDGLAVVLSHELLHQLAQHSAEQLSKQPIYIVISSVLYTITGIPWFNDLLIAGLFQMPASREMETEADHIGCELMARGCFNLSLVPQFWSRMNQFEKKLQASQGMREGLFQEFLSTHPATTKRLHDIESWMPQLHVDQESAGCHGYTNFAASMKNYFK